MAFPSFKHLSAASQVSVKADASKGKLRQILVDRLDRDGGETALSLEGEGKSNVYANLLSPLKSAPHHRSGDDLCPVYYSSSLSLTF